MEEARGVAEATAIGEVTNGKDTVLTVERFILIGRYEKCGEIDDPERSPEEKADNPVASDLDHQSALHCFSIYKGS
ncbi:hypothetical protein ACTG0T_09265 [Halococcus morrhuae DSM 1307]|uniref:hypothetical protein n=1 Tax=Halococcus morrhuae TaxID=2250 RepID=UPI003F864362